MAGGRIELVALTKRFTDIAVDQIDLTVDSGEFFSLLGPSGCGKTTTLRLIAGFEQPTEGTILLDGVEMTNIPPHRRNVNTALQERVGITFLYVTHDQEEALTMSDRLAVMHAGKIVQLGTPRTIYEEPADTYVADFLGVSNLMEVDVVERGPGSQCRVRLGEMALAVDRGDVDALGPAHALIRPERVR